MASSHALSSSMEAALSSSNLVSRFSETPSAFQSIKPFNRTSTGYLKVSFSLPSTSSFGCGSPRRVLTRAELSGESGFDEEDSHDLKNDNGFLVPEPIFSFSQMSGTIDFEVLRGLTNALIAAKKPDEAVQMLLASRKRLNEEKTIGSSDGTKKSAVKSKSDVDPIQVDLLLGKSYSEWGRVSDAVSVYNQLISTYPDDFRGYLAKGIILKENGNVGDAERMFIQARFFAPENAKALVDKYSK